MRLDTGKRVDTINAASHDDLADIDYGCLQALSISAVRDAFRWHLIETAPGLYDWSSVRSQLAAARRAGVQVCWDLAHFGLPDWLDPWGPDFVARFADYAEAAGRMIARESEAAPFWCPINEISYWAFAGGDCGHFAPLGVGRGAEWKSRLVAASLAAVDRLRAVDPRARFLQPEPVVHVVSDMPGEDEATDQTHSTYEAWDMLCGRACPELGGHAQCLDIVGVNFYSNNQWTASGRRLGMGDIGYRPLSQLLLDVWQRYRRPIMLSETGAEGANLRGWLRYIAGEVADAEAAGVQIVGVCLYPVMDYAGWTDDRHCACGVIGLSPDKTRYVREDDALLLREVFAQKMPWVAPPTTQPGRPSEPAAAVPA
ncbi:hypothetical protein sos41_28960 [Alphaproteobacteria bacterium SO-S41]|nr:hypothetical protein sos41_28960 [Alphaproteobacteria bacterium SO-S41]